MYQSTPFTIHSQDRISSLRACRRHACTHMCCGCFWLCLALCLLVSVPASGRLPLADWQDISGAVLRAIKHAHTTGRWRSETGLTCSVYLEEANLQLPTTPSGDVCTAAATIGVRGESWVGSVMGHSFLLNESSSSLQTTHSRTLLYGARHHGWCPLHQLKTNQRCYHTY